MEKRTKKIIKEIRSSIDAKEKVIKNNEILLNIINISDSIIDCINNGGKLLICGNGGSASDANHIAGEIVGRFQQERKAFSAISLNSDVATMTAIANDYGYEHVFSRQVEGLMKKDDILLGISTSGNSSNIVEAFKKSKEIGGINYLLTGKDGGILAKMADIAIIAPSDVTAHVQEVHECLFHIICGLVEEGLIKS